MEVKGLIAFVYLCNHLIQAHQCPAIQFHQLIICNAVPIRVEAVTIAQVAQNISCGIPDLLIGI